MADEQESGHFRRDLRPAKQHSSSVT
jgi:hypothetical protein